MRDRREGVPWNNHSLQVWLRSVTLNFSGSFVLKHLIIVSRQLKMDEKDETYILNVGIRFTRGPRAFRNYVLFDVFSIVQDGGWSTSEGTLLFDGTATEG